MMIAEKIKKNIITLIFISIGAIAGYLYWHFIGCTSGSCPLKSLWYYNVLTGSLIGYLIGSTIQDKLSKTNKESSNSK